MRLRFDVLNARTYPSSMVKENSDVWSVSVLMRREATRGPMARWQPWRWVLNDVITCVPQHGVNPHMLYDNENGQCWIHPSVPVELFRDDAEGYMLNLTTPQPAWFVMWRMEEQSELGQGPMPVPQAVSLSYHDAGRWLDAQESVEQVPAPPEVVRWLRAFTDAHYVPEPKRRQRPQSFQSLQDRFGNPVRISAGVLGRHRGGSGEDA